MIDRKTLSWKQKDAVECWRFNAYRAADQHGWGSPVERVWATSEAIYTSKPGDKYAGGSRDGGPVYATEAEAWDACLAEVRKWMNERMAKLEAMAKEARKAEQ